MKATVECLIFGHWLPKFHAAYQGFNMTELVVPVSD